MLEAERRPAVKFSRRSASLIYPFLRESRHCMPPTIQDPTFGTTARKTHSRQPRAPNAYCRSIKVASAILYTFPELRS